VSGRRLCLAGDHSTNGCALNFGMDADCEIVEVSFFGGKILVTFSDGMMALLDPGQIRHLAVEAGALKPLPKGPLDAN
jgi:hypothetical protein